MPPRHKPLLSESVATPEQETAIDTPAANALVRVRARTPLSEEVGGQRRRFEPGEEFELPAARAKAIQPLVEILT